MKKTSKEYCKAYYDSHKEDVRRRTKKNYIINKEKIKARSKAYYHANKENIYERRKGYYLKYRETHKEVIKKYYATHGKVNYYDITLDAYNELVRFQGGLCAICGKPEEMKHNGIIKNLSIDHNHKTKIVRGLLCNRCNSLLGFAKEDKLILENAKKYLTSVFVSGSFDLFHSGHIAFLKQAAEFGKLYVGIGSDASIKQLKNRETIFNEKERLYMVKAIRYVKGVWINSGMGNFDFFGDFNKVHIDIMIVNEDQDFAEKREFCAKRGIEYIILQRKPEPGLPERSSTQMREYYDK